MYRLSRVVGPVATNVHVLADARTREAIAIDTATPSLRWIADELAARDWTLRLIVSTHGHWDHIGDNAAVAEHTGADIAVHPLDRERLVHPQPLFAPFEDPAVRALKSGWPKEAWSASARSGSQFSTRRVTPRARSASWPRTRAFCSAATPCSPAAGAGSTCRAATRTRWSPSIGRLAGLDDHPGRLSGPTGNGRRPSAASERG